MDEELQRLREKRLREMEAHLQGGEDPTVTPVNGENFRDLLSANRFLVIDFWAEWCGPCRRVGPVIEALSIEFGGTVKFAKCNTDENPGIAGGFGITAIPTIILFEQGRPIDMVVGALPREALRARIQKAFRLSG